MAIQNPDDFLNELREDFRIEAAEHLQAISDGLLLLEKASDESAKKSEVERVFREIHSLKGASRAVNLLKIEQVCMSLEGCFQELKKGTLALQPAMFDLFHQSTDLLNQLVAGIDDENRAVPDHVLRRMTNAISNLVKDKHPPTVSPVAEPVREAAISDDILVLEIDSQPIPSVQASDTTISEVVNPSSPATVMGGERAAEKETVRVATAKLYDILRQAEEMTSIKVVLDYQLAQFANMAGEFSVFRSRHHDWLQDERNAGASSDAEVAGASAFLKHFEQKVLSLGSDLDQMRRSASRAVDDLMFDVKKMLLFPLSSLFAVVPKMVRDLSRESGKEVDLSLTGGDIEIDRRILEEMKDPLIHLIRNCIDHGLEVPDKRGVAGKRPTGRLSVSAAINSDHKIELVISDDGGGINTGKLLAAAIRNGIVRSDAVKQMTANEILMLVFASGVSTSDFITDVSGRGLGMAIVAAKIQKLGGQIAVSSTQGKGTTFTITLPQTMAAFRGIMVKAAEHLFLVPSTGVEQAIRVDPVEIRTVEARSVILYGNEHIALVRLSEVLGLPRRREAKAAASLLHVLVVSIPGSRVAFVVDEIFGEHEGAVRSLGNQLQHVTNIAGVVVMGDGKLVPVLQVAELLSFASGKGITTPVLGTQQDADDVPGEAPKRLLMAEDSITIRNMLRNMLEAAGFVVKTAVDGQDAFEQLQHETFDLVVSDIEMPRMNGFELTARIKNNKALADLPVVLVTALESPDDRARGMEAGANAYIVKSSFEKGNLIETINRLI